MSVIMLLLLNRCNLKRMAYQYLIEFYLTKLYLYEPLLTMTNFISIKKLLSIAAMLSTNLILFADTTLVVNHLNTTSVCPGGYILISYTYSTNLSSLSNTFTAQLSDSTGSFYNPTNISSIVNSTPMYARIPMTIPHGSGYRVRIISNFPYVVSNTNDTPIQIGGQGCPCTIDSSKRVWDVRVGTTDAETFTKGFLTNDGGYVLAGYTFGGISEDKTQNSWGSTDYWIIKLDSNRVKMWDYRYGGTGAEYLQDVKQTADGGFLLTGLSASTKNGDKSEVWQGLADIWTVKIDSLGIKQWDRTYGGTNHDAAFELLETSDGGIIYGGYTLSNISGHVSQPSRGDYDYFVLKTDSANNKIWDKRFGGSGEDIIYSMIKTTDGGYMLNGESRSGLGGDKTQASWGGKDIWLVKIDSAGNKQWDKRYGGSGDEEAGNIIQTNDGGYLFHCTSESPISGDKTVANTSTANVWMVKTDSIGNKLWDVVLKAHEVMANTPIVTLTDSTYLLGAIKDRRFWIAEIDKYGHELSEGVFGGYGGDWLYNFTLLNTGELLLFGASNSNLSGDKTQVPYSSASQKDYFMLKVSDFFANVTLSTISAVNDTICRGDTIQLTATGGNSYIWTGISDSTATITIAPLSTTTYTAVGTTSAGCTVSATKNITVKPVPTITISGPSALCIGDTIQLTASGANIYNWSNGLGSTASVDVTPLSTITYNVTSTATNGCIISAFKTITVDTVPLTVSITSSADSVCIGYPATLQASGGTTYIWALSSITTATRVVLPSATTTYTVTVGGTGICKAQVSKTIVVNSLPIGQIVGDTSICLGTSTTLMASGGVSYNWNNNLGNNSTVVVNPSSNSTYWVGVTDSNGCQANVSKTITVRPKPVASIIGPHEICNGDSVVLNAFGGANYVWDNGISNLSQYTISPLETTTYTLIASSHQLCSDTVTFTVNVHQPELATLNLTLCNGDSYNFGGQTITTEGVYYDTLQTIYGCDSIIRLEIQQNSLQQPVIVNSNDSLWVSEYTSYQWVKDDALIDGATGPIYIVTEEGNYTVIVTDENNCRDTSEIFNVIHTGLLNLSNNSYIKVFPNPSKGMFYILMPSKDVYNVYITDISGKLLEKFISVQNKSELQLNNIPNGVYLANFENDTKQILVKLVVLH